MECIVVLFLITSTKMPVLVTYRNQQSVQVSPVNLLSFEMLRNISVPGGVFANVDFVHNFIFSMYCSVAKTHCETHDSVDSYNML